MQRPLHLLDLSRERLLGEGQTASVYQWHEGKVLKVFRLGVLRSEVEAEARATRLAHAVGAGAPNVGDLLEVEGLLALVFDRVEGRSMLKELIEEPAGAESNALLLADLHAHIHAIHAPAQLPSQVDLLQIKINRTDVSPSLRARISRSLSEAQPGTSLCHGDFHPANVMLNGPKHSVIDWNDASRGNPALDLARTTVVMLSAALDSPELIGARAEAIEGFHRTYLNGYLSKFPAMRGQYERFLPAAAAGRLNECGEGARSWLFQLAEKCS